MYTRHIYRMRFLYATQGTNRKKREPKEIKKVGDSATINRRREKITHRILYAGQLNVTAATATTPVTDFL